MADAALEGELLEGEGLFIYFLHRDNATRSGDNVMAINILFLTNGKLSWSLAGDGFVEGV